MTDDTKDERRKMLDDLKRADRALTDALADIKDALRRAEICEDRSATKLRDLLRRVKDVGTDIEALHTSSSSGCFPGYARVATSDGERRLADVRVGDFVLTLCGRGPTLRAKARRVLRVLRHPPEPIWELVFEDDAQPLHTTRTHSFLTGRGWVRTDRLEPGDTFVAGATGVPRRLARAQPIGQTAPVYNLHTAGPHHFVVQGLVAHNFTRLRVARTVLHRLCVDPALRVGQFLRTAGPSGPSRLPSRRSASRTAMGWLAAVIMTTLLGVLAVPAAVTNDGESGRCAHEERSRAVRSCSCTQLQLPELA